MPMVMMLIGLLLPAVAATPVLPLLVQGWSSSCPACYEVPLRQVQSKMGTYGAHCVHAHAERACAATLLVLLQVLCIDL